MFPDETIASADSTVPKKRPAKKRPAGETTAEAAAEPAKKTAAKKRAPVKKAAAKPEPETSPFSPISNLKPETSSSAAPPVPSSPPSLLPSSGSPAPASNLESRISNLKSPASPGPSLFDELSGDEPTRPAIAPKPAAPKPVIAEDKDEVPRPKAGQIMSFDPDEDDSPAPSPSSFSVSPSPSPAPLGSESPIKNQESKISNPASASASPTSSSPISNLKSEIGGAAASPRPPLSAKDRLLFLKQKKFGNAARPFVQPTPGQPQPPQTSGDQPAPAASPASPGLSQNSNLEARSSNPASSVISNLKSEISGAAAPPASPAPSSPPLPLTSSVSPGQPRPPHPHGQRPPHQQNQNPQPRPPQPPQPPRPPRPEPPKGKPGRHRHADKEPLDNNTFWPGDLHNDPIFFTAAAADTAAAALIEAEKQPVLLNEWFKKPFKQLLADAQALGITFDTAPTKSFLNAAVIRHFAEKRIPTHVEGILFLSEEGDGAIVYTEDSYRLKPHSTYLSHHFVLRYGLRKGQILRAQVHPRRDTESCPFAVALVSVMGRDPKEAISFEQFEELIPYYPLQRIMLENDPKVSWDNNAMRVFDLLTPIGLGQRSLIVAPPRTGKTVILQCIANTVAVNSPEAHLIVLLVDERPEEVTDFSRQVKNGEVISSTFDETAESHVHAAEMVIEKARRMVEVGRHVIILLDSITRLGRAYNTLAPNSGKILSGGVEASALQRPKRFFGSARNIEGGGSLTIIGTALVETGSRMDEVIFEEFKGTGNMELHLDRALSDKRIFPAINLEKSGTRKEELLYHPMELEKVIALRRAMKGVPATDAMEMLITRIKKSKTNAEFLVGLNR